jgi:hypothetical protein
VRFRDGAESARAGGHELCDGAIDFFDIDPFLLALFNPAQYEIDYPDCNLLNADANVDGGIDFFDIDAFLDLLF